MTAIGSAVATIVRERDEYAASLAIAVRFLGKMRNGYAQLNGKETVLHWSNLDQSIAEVEAILTDPAGCLKAHDETRDAQIQQLQNVLAEAARLLIDQPWLRSEGVEIARFLGYHGEVTPDSVRGFLSSVSVEEAKPNEGPPWETSVS